MDVTGNLGDKLPAIVKTFTEAVKVDEDAALAALHAELTGLVQAESGIVSQLDAVLGARLTQVDDMLTRQRAELIAGVTGAIRGLLDGATVTNAIKL